MSAEQPSSVLPRNSEGGRVDLRAALTVVVALCVIGVLLGLVWAAWSPEPGIGLVRSPGAVQPDETENFVAGDGRFALLTGVAGLVAGLLAWTRKADRGPMLLLAVGIGGLAGALLTELTGHLVAGGTLDGPPNTLLKELPLSLHMPGLRFLEAGIAVLVYGMFTAFAARDDLGRPDPVRDALLAQRPGPPPGYVAYPAPQPYPPQQYPPQPYPAPQQYPPPPDPSVGPVPHPQDGGGDGDAPGVLQKRDLPPQ